LLAGLEERDVLLGNADAVAGPRVAADAGVPALYRERPEPSQLDAIATGQGGGNLVEDRSDDDLDIALIQMRVGFGELLHELRFRHPDRRSNTRRTIKSLPKHPPGVKRPAATAADAPSRAARPLGRPQLAWFSQK